MPEPDDPHPAPPHPDHKRHHKLSVRTLQAAVVLFQKKWAKLPGNVRGGVWILIASCFFSIMVAFIKLAVQRIPVPEVLFFRQLGVLCFALPTLWGHSASVFSTKRLDLQLLRVVMAFIAMLLSFTALAHLHLAEATTIQFAKNFFVTIVAIFVLHEVVGVRRWAALFVGFIGVLIVAWPTGGETFNIYVWMAIGSAAAVGVVTPLVRILAQIDKPVTILCYQAVGVGLLMLPLTIYHWKTPTLTELGLIIAIAGLSTIGQICNILGLRAGEASAVAPLDYTRLLFALALGYVLFDEWPEPRVFIGAAVIIGAAIYTLHRERVLAHRSSQPVTAPIAKDM